MKKNLVLIILFTVFLILSAVFFVFFVKTDKFSFQAAGGGATLALSPASSNVTIGNTFTVSVILNTGGQATAGSDAYINYNPQDLEVQDALSGTNGVQIQPGTLYAQTTWNNVNTTTGKIIFSGSVNSGAAGYNGTGTLASITFKALRTANPSAVSFDFTLGATNDSNVILKTTGTDITDLLDSVVNGSYVLAPSDVPATVKIQLQGRSNKADTTNTNIEVRNIGQTLPLFQKNNLSTDIAGTGTFTISGVPSGNYDFRIKVGYYLTKTLTNLPLIGPLTLDFGTLRGGDLNNDNIVNGLDFTYLVNKWTQNDPIADINKDGTVNNADFVVIDADWFMQGN